MLVAEKKSFVGKNAKKPKTSFSFWAFLFLFLGIAASGIFLAISSYEKTIKKNELGEIISISTQQKAKFLADSLKLTQCVQYALLAKSGAWYEKCDGSGKVFLYRGEVWKYGVTCKKNPENRYPSNFYISNNVLLDIQFKGTRLACEIEEKRKLYAYPAHPENLKRKLSEKLILPPRNCKLQ